MPNQLRFNNLSAQFLSELERQEREHLEVHSQRLQFYQQQMTIETRYNQLWFDESELRFIGIPGELMLQRELIDKPKRKTKSHLPKWW